MTARQTIVDGLRTAYFDVGEGVPIIALHGIPTSSALFAPLIPHMAGYRLIAPDLLGQGQTEVPRSGRLDFAAYFRHLKAFLDDFAPPTFHLLVHDFGAVLGLAWAADHATRLQSIIVLSTTVTFSVRVAWLYAANLVLGRAALRWLMPWTLKRERVVPPETLREWARPWTRQRLLRGIDHFSPRRLRHVRQRLVFLTRPVLLIWGEDDEVFPTSHADVLRRTLPQATFVTIPKCGHWAPLDAPHEVADLVRAFCSQSRMSP